ncbi:hypothetical protein BJ742DRAFT_787497 [Cladochytrium replicatum]|nr:hypothetical protein BJ742DRAFT_787497 [Cladochytrium replicatum]
MATPPVSSGSLIRLGLSLIPAIFGPLLSMYCEPFVCTELSPTIRTIAVQNLIGRSSTTESTGNPVADVFLTFVSPRVFWPTLLTLLFLLYLCLSFLLTNLPLYSGPNPFAARTQLIWKLTASEDVPLFEDYDDQNASAKKSDDTVTTGKEGVSSWDSVARSAHEHGVDVLWLEVELDPKNGESVVISNVVESNNGTPMTLSALITAIATPNSPISQKPKKQPRQSQKQESGIEGIFVSPSPIGHSQLKPLSEKVIGLINSVSKSGLKLPAIAFAHIDGKGLIHPPHHPSRRQKPATPPQTAETKPEPIISHIEAFTSPQRATLIARSPHLLYWTGLLAFLPSPVSGFLLPSLESIPPQYVEHLNARHLVVLYAPQSAKEESFDVVMTKIVKTGFNGCVVAGPVRSLWLQRVAAWFREYENEQQRTV